MIRPIRKRQVMKRIMLLLIALSAIWLVNQSAQQSTLQGQIPADRAIHAVENDLVPTIVITNRTVEPLSLSALMERHRIPAVSIAVIDGGRIAWARAFGIADSASNRLATTETLFQAASISKPVAALAALRLVEMGFLNLDSNVNNYLQTWHLPENEFTENHPVTLRHLLTHTGGLTVHGFPGYERSADQPTLVQVLDGSGPANTIAIRADTIPGELWRYSGGGYTVMQQMLIDITGRSFPEIMRELVLEPAGMTESTYEQPLPPARYGQAATAYTTSGEPVTEDWHVYPEMAAAGLWTTPTDLARLAIVIQRTLDGESDPILSQAMAEAMLEKGLGDWGLGFRIRGQEGSLSFDHGGSNAGFQSAFFALARTGQGAAVMTNSDTGGEILGTVLRTLATIYEWPTEAFPLRKVEAADVRRSTLRRLAGTYSYFADMNEITFTHEGTRLFVDYVGRWQAEVFPLSETAWVVPVDGTRFDFEMESSGPAASVTVNGRIRAERKR